MTATLCQNNDVGIKAIINQACITTAHDQSHLGRLQQLLIIATKHGATATIMKTLETEEYICKSELQVINEVVMLIRLLHQKAVGKDVNLEETIGDSESSKVPQASFESNGSMRQGCKA